MKIAICLLHRGVSLLQHHLICLVVFIRLLEVKLQCYRLRVSWFSESYKTESSCTFFLRPVHYCTQKKPFSMLQRSSTLDQEGLVDHSWVSVQRKHRFSTYFHLEKTSGPLPAFLCPRKRPLLKRRFDGLGRHHTG